MVTVTAVVPDPAVSSSPTLMPLHNAQRGSDRLHKPVKGSRSHLGRAALHSLDCIALVPALPYLSRDPHHHHQHQVHQQPLGPPREILTHLATQMEKQAKWRP